MDFIEFAKYGSTGIIVLLVGVIYLLIKINDRNSRHTYDAISKNTQAFLELKATIKTFIEKF